MEHSKDVVTIHTKVGYAKVSCNYETTVKNMICTALRTVSINSPSQLYGLYWCPSRKEGTKPKYLLCRSLTWSEIKSMYSPNELMLSICLYPTKFEEAARSDRSTLFYLYQQTKELYYNRFKFVEDAEMAFELGCLEIRSVVPNPMVEARELLELVEKIRPINSFFPPCVLQQNKTKSLRRMVHNQLLKIKHYSEEDCVLDMLNRYLILLQFDREIIRCWFGAGYGIPAELVIGPRFQVSIKIENARQPRLLAYFASIRQVLVSKFPTPQGDRYQVRLAIEPSTDPNARLEMITFTFDSQESADTVVHLLDGYCGESVGAVLQGTNHLSMINVNQSDAKEEFLPNGCPYRLREDDSDALHKLEIPRSSVVLEQVLGDGQFGDVYKGSYKKSSNSETLAVAVKTCKPDSSTEDRQQILEEARILGEFNHPHIIRLLGVCSGNPIWLVMEYAPLGELRHYLLANSNRIPLPLRVTFCYQIVTALTCLEERKCVHRDIAARNILVARKDWVKLADFGMARMLDEASEFQAEKGRKMPIKWMPPESIHERRFTPASDVWMFGVCMWEILSGGIKPFADITNAEAAELVTRGQRLKRPSICPPHLYILMLECWSTNPMRRPKFSVLKPRLREVVAQTSSMSNMNVLHEGESLDSVGNPISDSFASPSSSRSDSQRGGASDSQPPKPPSHSHWNEVTELQVNGKPKAAARTQRLPVVPERDPSGRNGHQNWSSGRNSAGTAEPSTRMIFQPMNRTQIDEWLPTERLQNDRIQSGRNSNDAVSNHTSTEPQRTCASFNPYENEVLQDPIYNATVHVVKTVRRVSQQLSEAEPKEYVNLAKEIGVAVKELFLSVEAIYGTEPDRNEIFLAERQLNASMYHLISTIRESKHSQNRGPLGEDFRRHLMTLSYVVANDAHSLYSAVHAHRMRDTPARQHRTL